ncbi:Uncharacterised protein [Mycolicibacterium vanbaalenii]|uniref:DoxX family protein n=2 Tax=Mycolicibacterium vanbaalenii TaxID=110539 RepID=A0A5S9R912_MYCVN|nr:Uncharacterised protein [Mycolicibacterium vanbaalenii]
MIMNQPTAQNSAKAIDSSPMTTEQATRSTTGGGDIGLLLLRLGVGAALLQAGLIKALDLTTTSQFMADAGWRLPKVAAFMVTAAETLGGIGLILGALTPLAACAAVGSMLCAWAVNVSGTAFWSEPFNIPFLIGVGAVALLFTGAGGYSVDRLAFNRTHWPKRVAVGLLVLAFAAAVLTWVALYGVNPIHLTTPTP